MDHLLVGGLYKASFHSLSSSLLSHIPTLWWPNIRYLQRCGNKPKANAKSNDLGLQQSRGEAFLWRYSSSLS
jgi:hypothetical protein